ncbi:coiled-coil domain-containing protein [Lonepinella sp. BR2474]|uniref:coiled-coil domain-containing protein n=1 Tax=Lonepinella sp. BR2474 TaxID=3434548 RepID=UPI003F6DFDDE
MAIKPLYAEKLSELSCKATADCSATESELAQAQADLVAKDETIAEKQTELDKAQVDMAKANDVILANAEEIDQLKSDLKNMTQKAEQKQADLDIANERIAELEKQLTAQPTECDVLAKYLDPVVRLNGETIYYGLKDNPDCESLNVEKGESLGGETITNVTGEN